VQPTLACYQEAAFNTTTCSWDITGTQPEEPILTECSEVAVFDTTECQWIVSIFQEPAPIVACYQTVSFNNETCSWDVSGTQPVQPVLQCYQTATFNSVFCAWVVSGTQDPQPTLACYETATFNTTSCVWDVSGTQPSAPSNLLSWQTATFNIVSCQWDITGTEPQSSSLLNLTMFIEGYYIGSNTMSPVKANQGIGTSTTIVDDILVELRHATTYALVASTQAILLTNGTAACTFSTAPNGSFYVVVKHRNAVQTWSANPVAIGATSSYNFTTAANKAFGDNMKEVESGVWAFYTGDLNQDDLIDLTDYSIWETDNNNFEFGNFPTDLNGDGLVDLSDYSIWESNSNAFIFSFYPQ
jgi:hypothetical protein